jgi:hypothetical protein
MLPRPGAMQALKSRSRYDAIRATWVLCFSAGPNGMTRIPYVSRSSFLSICEESIDRSRAELCAGQLIRVILDKPGGYSGCEVAAISESAASHCDVDRRWEDPTRFPVRLRAAATALRRKMCFGRFELRCDDGELTFKLEVPDARQRSVELASAPPVVAGGCTIDPAADLINPKRLWSKDEVFAKPSPIPRAPGAYAWYFRRIPDGVVTDGCIHRDSCCLLYVGIAPTEPPRNGRQPSSQRLFNRIRYHYAGNAQGSTLRLSLGCLLAKEIGTSLKKVGSGKRLTFGAEAERALSAWMQENAFVAWTVHPSPWLLERDLIGHLSLPLNIKLNKGHPFQPTLLGIRRKAKDTARGSTTREE